MSQNILLDKIEQEILDEKLSKSSLIELTNIVQRSPQNYRAHIILGNCCDSMGLPEQAMEQYKLAFKYGPDKAEAFLELVKALVKSGQVTAAGNLLKEAVNRFPSDPHILLWTGNQLYKEQKYKEAEDLYRQALYKSGRKPVLGVCTALARLRLREGKYLIALGLATIDLTTDANYPPANEVVGLTLMNMGKFEKAVPHLQIAFNHQPDNYVVSFDFAQASVWCGKYDQAIVPLLCSLVTAKTYQHKELVQNTIDRIVPYLSKNAVQKSISDVRQYRFLEQNVDVHLALAELCLRKNLFHLAMQEYLQSIKIAPQHAEAKYKLALFLENYNHDYVSALRYLREAQALSPFNYKIGQHLMRLQDRLNMANSDWAWQFKDHLNLHEG